MTCIVGVKHQGVVCIGGDSAYVAGNEIGRMRDTKVTERNGFVFGCAGSGRACQIVRTLFVPPAMEPGTDLMTYLVGPFVETLRTLLTERGVTKEDDIPSMVVGYQGRLFELDHAFAVSEPVHNYAAIGAGFSWAQGTLAALHLTDAMLDAPAQVELALHIAAEHCWGVQAPFTILEVPQG